MAVRYIYHDQGKGEKLALSSNETGLRVSVESAGVFALSKPLTDEDLRVLAQALVIKYFERTKKIIWPVNAVMVEHYERTICDAEDERLKWLQESPAEENRARAPEYAERIAARRRSVVEVEKPQETPPEEPPRRRRLVVLPADLPADPEVDRDFQPEEPPRRRRIL